MLPCVGEALLVWSERGDSAVRTSPVVRVFSVSGGRRIYFDTESGSRYLLSLRA